MNKESEDGNIEYKLSILNKSDSRIEELATQMSFRLEEGGGECIYVLGVGDDGTLHGISDTDYSDSLDNLNKIIHKCNSIIVNTSKRQLENNHSIYEILIRENNINNYIEIKIAIAGNVDSGKSSLIGVLVNGKNDNGRGSARLSVFNYIHEVKSGRTSSIAHHILGFDNTGNIINYDDVRSNDWTDIVKRSSKVISFFDLAGHEKYLKTTIAGLSSSIPDMCFITVGANMGITRMTKEHIFLCVMLNIPFVFIITKIDICKNRQNILDETITNIKKTLKMPGVRKLTYRIRTKDDILLCTKSNNTNSVVPLFFISNVTGEGIDNLKYFLNIIHKRKDNINNHSKSVEYHIDTIFYVTGVGTVVGGHLKHGSITVGDKLYLGPNNNSSEYEQFQVKSIHSKKTLVNTVKSSGYACICLRKAQRKNIRKGQVLLSHKEQLKTIREFEAKVTVLKTHSTSIKKGYEPVLHVSTIRQTAKVLDIYDVIKSKNNPNIKEDDNKIVLRTGDKATIRFRFKYRPEYICKDYKILLAEGKVKIVGVVTDLKVTH
jgi:GTPase